MQASFPNIDHYTSLELPQIDTIPLYHHHEVDHGAMAMICIKIPATMSLYWVFYLYLLMYLLFLHYT